MLWQMEAWQNWLSSWARWLNIQVKVNPTHVSDQQPHLFELSSHLMCTVLTIKDYEYIFLGCFTYSTLYAIVIPIDVHCTYYKYSILGCFIYTTLYAIVIPIDVH